MRLTPAYLTRVASFYDMFETHARSRATRVRVHEHLLLAARRRRAVRGDPRGGRRRPRVQRARVRVPRRLRHRADGLGRRRVRRPADARGRPAAARRRPRRGGRCCPTSSSRARPVADPRANAEQSRVEHPRRARRRRTHAMAVDSDPVLLFNGHRRAGAEHAAGLRAPRRLRRRCARRWRCRPRRSSPQLEASGLRGRGGAGFAMGKKASFLPKGDDGQVPRLQRRRVRAGDLQGPRADAEDARTC